MDDDRVHLPLVHGIVRGLLQRRLDLRQTLLAAGRGRVIIEALLRLIGVDAGAYTWLHGPDAFKRLEQDIRSRRRSLNHTRDEYRDDLNLRRNEELGKLLRKISEVVRQVGEEERRKGSCRCY